MTISIPIQITITITITITTGLEVQQKRYSYILHSIGEEESRRPQSCHFLRQKEGWEWHLP
jgi:hypothetical protein